MEVPLHARTGIEPVTPKYIQVPRIDFSVGVLRGILSRVDLDPVAIREIELAIPHVRAAARLVERIQQFPRFTKRSRRRKAPR